MSGANCKTGTHYHPIHSNKDGKLNTYSGKVLDLINPTPEMICIEDIAAGLSKECRFGGQISHFYPVVQHSIVMCCMVPPGLRKEALFHDATEAYLKDIPKPLKVLLGEAYACIDRRLMNVISKKYGLDAGKLEALKEYDKQLIEIEHELLQKNNDFPWITLLSDLGFPLDVKTWDNVFAYNVFMNYAEIVLG